MYSEQWEWVFICNVTGIGEKKKQNRGKKDGEAPCVSPSQGGEELTGFVGYWDVAVAVVGRGDGEEGGEVSL
jgi:hypothetical protein